MLISIRFAKELVSLTTDSKQLQEENGDFPALFGIYNLLVIPIVTYAAEAWKDQIDQSSRTKLIGAQRKTLVTTTGAYTTVSKDAMPVVAGVIPLDLEAKRRR